MLIDHRQLTGLSPSEAASRLEANGYNELPSSRPRTGLAIALEIVREPMFLLLIGSGTIYLLLGSLDEAVFLLAFVLFVIGITLYQQRKTERALGALRDLSSPRALVIRGGERVRIPGREVVPGDIIILAEGDRVPADAVVLDALNLSVDESILTGESAPVRKAAWDGKAPFGRPGGDDLAFVYSGTLVVSGYGIARAETTGAATELGRIGRSLGSIETEKTPLERETGELVRTLAIVGVLFCALVVVVYGISRNDWLNGILAGLTTAMALLPEEFPVVLTIFLALGAWRLSKRRVLTRRMPAVETLGSATVLAVDKTGTITENRMRIAMLFAGDTWHEVSREGGELPETFHQVVEFGILASQIEPFDPMEKAFRQLGYRDLQDTEHLHEDWTLVREYPLSGSLLAMSRVWKSVEGGEYVIAAKGAPEAIADLCHLGEEAVAQIGEHVSRMAAKGLRVLAVARASLGREPLPGEQHDFHFEWLGLAGLDDPVRQSVPDAVRECGEAGIRVVMITGDYPVTARSVAEQIGLPQREACVTGPELDQMEDVELRRRVGAAGIFARVVPEQKLRLVEALKAGGAIVAMTGDGVNDAPALKAAHIGIAMGDRGSDVARESAALVLLDDDFSSIVGAVRLGRTIYDNLRKAMTYIVAVHVPIAGLSLIPVALGWPLVLFPVHIVFMELIIDPACSIVFEAEPGEPDVMRRPPRRPGGPLFGRRMLAFGLLQGAVVLAVTLAIFSAAGGSVYQDVPKARTLPFGALVSANVGLILANRSWSRTILESFRVRNRAVLWVGGLAIGVLGLVVYVPFLREIFLFSRLSAGELLACLTAGTASVAWFEAAKIIHRRARGRAHAG